MLQVYRQRWRKGTGISRLRLRTKTMASQSVFVGTEVWVPLSSRKSRDLIQSEGWQQVGVSGRWSGEEFGKRE